MLLHSFCLSCSAILMNEIRTSIPSGQATFIYKMLILGALLPYFFYCGIFDVVKTKRLGVHIGRGVISVSAKISWFYALQHGLSATDALAIDHFEAIIVLTIGVMFFGEEITLHKVFAVLLGFCGVCIVAIYSIKSLRGETGEYTYLFALLAVVLWSVNSTALKSLTRTEKTSTTLFYSFVLTAFFAFLHRYLNQYFHLYILKRPEDLEPWVSLSIYQMVMISMVALVHLIHTIAIFHAFKRADISVLKPFEYTKIIFAAILNYIIHTKYPSMASWIGYTLIIVF